MGTIKQPGTRHRCPVYIDNKYGEPSWSGKHMSDITGLMLYAMHDFIIEEGRRHGYNDSAQRQIGKSKQFFHHEFLDGWAHNLWLEHYKLGIREEMGLTIVPDDSDTSTDHQTLAQA
jgi:hypothetical protein